MLMPHQKLQCLEFLCLLLQFKCSCCKMTHITRQNNKQLFFWTLLAHNLGCPPFIHTHTHTHTHTHECIILSTHSYLHTLRSPLLSQCDMHPDTGEPQDTLTPKAKQLIQDLGSQNTRISEIIAQEDRAVFTAILKEIDKANEHATSNAMKVGLPCCRTE